MFNFLQIKFYIDYNFFNIHNKYFDINIRNKLNWRITKQKIKNAGKGNEKISILKTGQFERSCFL